MSANATRSTRSTQSAAAPSTAAARDDRDTPWKGASARHCPDLMAVYFPRAHAAIDGRRPHVLLQQELARAARHGGAEEWLFIPLEAQGGHHRPFAERLFTCTITASAPPSTPRRPR